MQRSETAIVAMGCFWGAERLFWSLPGVLATEVGYTGGVRPDPSYEQVCTGATGHAEAVRIEFDPAVTSYSELLTVFWENHDPTQRNRQGNDVGTQYRSALFVTTAEQQEVAEASRAAFSPVVAEAGRSPITTEVTPAGPFYRAEEYHQRYLEKNPGGYCNHGPTGLKVCAL
jgi:peptide-methionine (S)-S-oxide reductase